MATAHYHAPDAATRLLNRAVGWLNKRGISLAGAQNLTVTGRKSGKPQEIPVNPMSLDGKEYLVSPRGNGQWVRNVRVNGDAELRKGSRTRAVRLVEVGDAERPPVIAAYLRKWGWEVGRFLPEGLSAKASADEIAPYAHLLPVFQVVPR